MKANESVYATFANNPIFFNDPNGQNATKYYDQQGNLLKDVNDGIDQSVEVNKDQFNQGLEIAKKSGLDIDNKQADAKKFTSEYKEKNKLNAKVVFNVKGTATTVTDVLSGQPVVPYTTDCEDAARTQCNNAGVQPAWRNGGITMLADNNLEGQKAEGTLTENRPAARAAIDNSLEGGDPVMVGLSYGGGTKGDPGNRNKLVGHYVVIVARGNDYNGDYYDYYDNFYGGKKTTNRLYVQSNGLLKNTLTSNNFVVADVFPNQ